MTSPKFLIERYSVGRGERGTTLTVEWTKMGTRTKYGLVRGSIEVNLTLDQDHAELYQLFVEQLCLANDGPIQQLLEKHITMEDHGP